MNKVPIQLDCDLKFSSTGKYVQTTVTVCAWRMFTKWWSNCTLHKTKVLSRLLVRIYQYLYSPNDIKKSIFTVGNVNIYATTLKNKIPIQLDRDLKSWFMVYMVEQQTGRGVETLPSE